MTTIARARAGTALLAAAVFALTMELAARLDDWLAFGAPLAGRYDSDLLRRPDADGIPRNVPGARFEKWRIDGAGFRGPEVTLAKARGQRRIVCLGQSESFGLYEDEGGEWPARLRRLVAGLDPDVEVVNASVVGTSRWSRVPYLERYVLPYAPDVVVLYPSVYGEAMADPHPAPRPAAAAAPSPAPVAVAAPGLDLHPRVLAKLSRDAKKLVPPRLMDALRSWKTRRALRQEERWALRGRPALDQVPAENVEAYRRHLRELVALLRARGVQPVLATYPTLAHADNLDRYRLTLLQERLWHVQLSEAGMLDAATRMNEATRTMARELDVPLADLDARVPRTAAAFADQVHYTDLGAEAVAQGVLATLQAAGLVTEAPRPARR